MATLKPRTVTVTIYQGDDYDTLRDLRRAAETARRHAEAAKDPDGTPLRGGDETPGTVEAADAQAAMEAYDAFVDEAADRAVGIELHAIGRRRFRDLMAEHPARKVMVKVPAEPVEDGPPGEPTEREETHEDDAAYAVNVETFPQALLTFIDGEVRTIAAPEFGTRQAVTDFLDNDLAEGDWPGLWTAAYYLNRMPSADPESSRYSVARRSIDETSK